MMNDYWAPPRFLSENKVVENPQQCWGLTVLNKTPCGARNQKQEIKPLAVQGANN
jgi:hypothetical protein